jgi:uncharacterized iron-regulated membrane protein
MVAGRLRVVLVKLHLYVGLSFGLLLVMLGLTGSVIAWRDELDAVLNPDLLVASADVPLPVSPDTVQAVSGRLIADSRYGRPNLLSVPDGAREVFIAWYPLKGPGAVPGRSRQVMIDPATRAVKGERVWGEPGLSRERLMPTLFHLHHYLLSGETGRTLLGITGLTILLTVLAGVALWWPRPRMRSVAQAFSVRYGGSGSRLTYSLHRAAGIFAAPVLATMAFSGWYLDLPKWVTPLVGSVMTVTPPGRPSSATPPPGAKPIDAAQAMRVGQSLYPSGAVTRIGFPRKPGDAYELRVRQPGEVRQGGATRVWVDAYSGRRLGVRDPQDAPAGDTVLNWLYPLHTGEWFGLPGRIFISMFGFAPLAFALTGMLIWLKRRRGHRRHLRKTLQRRGRS